MSRPSRRGDRHRGLWRHVATASSRGIAWVSDHIASGVVTDTLRERRPRRFTRSVGSKRYAVTTDAVTAEAHSGVITNHEPVTATESSAVRTETLTWLRRAS